MFGSHRVSLRALNDVPLPRPKVKVINVTKTTATFTCTDTSNTATGFIIYKGDTIIKKLGANVKSYTITGLTADTDYDYVYGVKSYNASGRSVGKLVSFKTKKGNTTTISKPTAPSNLNAINVTKTTATLTWRDKSNNETGFKVYKGTDIVK